MAPGYQRLRAGGATSSTVVLPLAWTVRSDDDPRRQFTVRVPLAQTDTEGSKSYDVGGGASLGVPLTSRWTLARTALRAMHRSPPSANGCTA